MFLGDDPLLVRKVGVLSISSVWLNRRSHIEKLITAA
jgi:hypothetical protein